MAARSFDRHIVGHSQAAHGKAQFQHFLDARDALLNFLGSRILCWVNEDYVRQILLGKMAVIA